MLVVPLERYPEVEAKVDSIRRTDKMLLAYETKMLNEELAQMSVSMTELQLNPGNKYGVVVYHPDANAWRDGKLVLRHGEVYIELWTWSGPNGASRGKFYNVNGWGQISEVAAFRVPILEMPQEVR